MDCYGLNTVWLAGVTAALGVGGGEPLVNDFSHERSGRST
jgi:hypothetical protein